MSNSPSLGREEPADGPAISDRYLEELDGFVVGGGGTGAGVWWPGVWGGGRDFDFGEQFFDRFVLLRGGGCETRVGVSHLEEGWANVCRGVGHPVEVAVEGLKGKVSPSKRQGKSETIYLPTHLL